MAAKRRYSAQYMWVSQDFYNWINTEANKCKQNGVMIGASAITHKLIHDAKLPEKINVSNMFIGFNRRGRRKNGII